MINKEFLLKKNEMQFLKRYYKNSLCEMKSNRGKSK